VVEKNRYGDKGTVHLIFRPQVGLFREEERP
jgi:replicative DNA helicase